MTKKENKTHHNCMGMILPVSDAIQVLNGKWKLPILISLSFGNKRFGEIARDIPLGQRIKTKQMDYKPIA